MAENDIIFSCTECGTQLAVAIELAGIEGPCPACNAQIRAPELLIKAPESELPPIPVAEGHLFPKVIGASRQAKIDFGLDDLATYEEADVDPHDVKEPPALADQELKGDAPTLAAETQLSEFNPEFVVGRRQFGELPEIWIKDHPEPVSWYAKPWIWGMVAVVVAMIFLLVDVFKTVQGPVGGVVIPVRPDPVVEPKTPKPEIPKPEVLKPELPKPELPKPEVPKPEVPKPEVPKPEVPKPEVPKPEVPKPEVPKPEVPKPEVPKPTPVLIKLKPLPTGTVPDEKLIEPPVVLPPIDHPPAEIIQVKPKSAERLAIEEKLQGLDAQLVLDLFLNVKTLDERVPLMLSQTASDELEASCLAKPLSPVTRTQLEYRDVNSETGVVDSYFSVLFEGSVSLANPQTLLVRQPRDEPPKVVVDPFLDLYGGRLMAFASKPGQSAKTFEVYASALAHCKDAEVPGYQSKMTLSLQARDHGAELARAYFDKKSKIAALLEDGTFRLSYGHPIPCRVLLKWNASENPNRPYIEAVEIKAFEWGGE